MSNQNEIPTYSQYYENNKNKNSEEILQKLEKNFSFRGSDKVENNYHLIYSCIFTELDFAYKILEIGLGTNDPTIISSMGIYGKPGASIKAFRDTFINSNIYGADVDKKYYLTKIELKLFLLTKLIFLPLKILVMKLMKSLI